MSDVATGIGLQRSRTIGQHRGLGPGHPRLCNAPDRIYGRQLASVVLLSIVLLQFSCVVDESIAPGPIDADPNSAIEGAIPALAYDPPTDGASPTNTLILAFELGTTVGEANDVITQVGGEIVGGVPGVEGSAPGLLVLRTPTTTPEEMRALSSRLRAEPAVLLAVKDAILRSTLLPEASTDLAGEWDWNRSPRGGNYGFELSRIPQMWNLGPAVRKTGVLEKVAVIDVGFFEHRDLDYAWDGVEDTHGTHVCGIIGARWGDGLGIDGVSPFVSFSLHAGVSLAENITDDLPAAFDSGARVINISLGHNYHLDGIDIGEDLDEQEDALEQGRVVEVVVRARADQGDELPIIVVGAGNESKVGLPQEARWGSPFATAALEYDLANFIVVEAISHSVGQPGDATHWAHTSRFGHISAPGDWIFSTIDGDSYDFQSGTSMAAPHVSGLVAFLLAVEPSFPAPTLNSNPMLDLLRATSVPVGGAASNRIDAFAAVMAVDGVTGSRNVLRMLADIDDGTVDGNQRIDLATGAEVVEEDADGDGDRGDGIVDMSDFRRFRDWLLMVEDGGDINGRADHPKQDLNWDGVVSPDSFDERLHPRGDLNGDGDINRRATAMVPGAIDAEVTDLGVLQRVFEDPDVDANRLPDLLESGDFEVSLDRCLGDPGTNEVVVTVRQAGDTLVQRDIFASADVHRPVITMPVGSYDIEAVSFDSAGGEVGRHAFPLTVTTAGQDQRWDVPCTSSTGVVYRMYVLPVGTAYGLNDAGEVLAWDPTTTGMFVWTLADGATPLEIGTAYYMGSDGPQPIPTVEPLEGDDEFWISSISPGGLIAGVSRNSHRMRERPAYNDGTTHRLLAAVHDPPSFTVAYHVTGINDAGTVIGSAGSHDGDGGAAIFEGDTPTFLPTPPGFAAVSAELINARGWIVGALRVQNVSSFSGLWRDGTLHIYDDPADGIRWIGVINESGVLVADSTACENGGGYCWKVSYDGLSWVEFPNNFTDELGTPGDPYWHIGLVVAINASGVILVNAYNDRRVGRPAILVPEPAP